MRRASDSIMIQVLGAMDLIEIGTGNELVFDAFVTQERVGEILICWWRHRRGQVRGWREFMGLVLVSKGPASSNAVTKSFGGTHQEMIILELMSNFADIVSPEELLFLAIGPFKPDAPAAPGIKGIKWQLKICSLF